jgi:hypothetical protein
MEMLLVFIGAVAALAAAYYAWKSYRQQLPPLKVVLSRFKENNEKKVRLDIVNTSSSRFSIGTGHIRVVQTNLVPIDKYTLNDAKCVENPPTMPYVLNKREKLSVIYIEAQMPALSDTGRAHAIVARVHSYPDEGLFWSNPLFL